MSRRWLALLLLLPSLAHAHGGLPISEEIIPRNGQLVVPTMWWGVFLGTDGGPWRWICEEAMVPNLKKDRRWTLTGDGTYHVTDYSGITTSRDAGCTWAPATGELSMRSTTAITADPKDGKRAWVTTASGMDAPMNALYTTDDDGLTWTTVLEADEYLNGVALSSDGQVIYVAGTARAMGPAMVNIHVSKDGGKTWIAAPLVYEIAPMITPTEVEPVAVDPADPSVVYLHVTTDPTQTILRAGSYGQTVAEVVRVDGAIGQPAFDDMRNRLLVPTQLGLYRGARDGTPLAKVSNLSRTQCVIPIGAAIYACAWNYAPDNAAIARSDDGGDTFVKVFQYADTVGPTTSCPASTPVGQTCPGIWELYASQLGIPNAPDMGAAPPPPPSCACAIGAPARPTRGLAAILFLVAAVLIYRRRKAVAPA